MCASAERSPLISAHVLNSPSVVLISAIMVEYAWTVVETDFIEQLMWRMVGNKLQKGAGVEHLYIHRLSPTAIRRFI